MHAGSLLRKWREKLKLTQGAAADLLGISQSTLSDYENQRALPGIVPALRIEDRTKGLVPAASWKRASVRAVGA